MHLVGWLPKKVTDKAVTYGQMALSQMYIGRNDDAIKTFENALAAGMPPGANTRGLVYYNGFSSSPANQETVEAVSYSFFPGIGNEFSKPRTNGFH